MWLSDSNRKSATNIRISSHRFVISNPNIAKLAIKFGLADPILRHIK
jgi:hypothetical protein